MGFDRQMIGMRDNFVTATLGGSEEDEFGNIMDVNDVVLSFWSEIIDNSSERIITEGDRRNVIRHTMVCDALDVRQLTIEHRITIDGDPTIYIPVDIYENKYKFEATVIIQSI